MTKLRAELDQKTDEQIAFWARMTGADKKLAATPIPKKKRKRTRRGKKKNRNEPPAAEGTL